MVEGWSGFQASRSNQESNSLKSARLVQEGEGRSCAVETRLEPVAPKRNAYQQEVKERGWYEYFFVWARLRNREGLGNQNKIAGRPIIRRPGWLDGDVAG
jgi:hypothetical protein